MLMVPCSWRCVIATSLDLSRAAIDGPVRRCCSRMNVGVDGGREDSLRPHLAGDLGRFFGCGQIGDHVGCESPRAI